MEQYTRFPNYAEVGRLHDDRIKCYGVWGKKKDGDNESEGKWMNFLLLCLQNEKIKDMAC